MRMVYILAEALNGEEKKNDIERNLAPEPSQNKSNDMQIIFNSFRQENYSVLIPIYIFIYIHTFSI